MIPAWARIPKPDLGLEIKRVIGVAQTLAGVTPCVVYLSPAAYAKVALILKVAGQEIPEGGVEVLGVPLEQGAREVSYLVCSDNTIILLWGHDGTTRGGYGKAGA